MNPDEISGCWEQWIEKARRKTAEHSRRIAAISGNVHCWAQVAGVWFTGVIRHVYGDVAIFCVSADHEVRVVLDQVVFEQPCRWPV